MAKDDEKNANAPPLDKSFALIRSEDDVVLGHGPFRSLVRLKFEIGDRIVRVRKRARKR